MIYLSGFVLRRTTLAEARLHFGKRFVVLSSFKDHSAFKLCKGQEHSQDKIAAERVFDKADVQNMYLNVTGKQFAYSLYSFNSAAGKPVQLCDDQCVSALQLGEQGGELRAVNRLACVGFCDDLIAAIFGKRCNLLFEAAAVYALAHCADAGISVYHGFSPLFLAPSNDTGSSIETWSCLQRSRFC